ncbi:MAG: RnfABCDGE type electron transport complex subunit G [Clostridia bacterium]|nr:RnfABCDGE type electron transport complex subunit G [Clostridia bacterium]
MNKKLPAWIVLTVISLVAALALGATYNGTKDRIAAQEAEKAVAVRQELLPMAADFEQIAAEGETEVFKGMDEAGQAVGYVSVGTVTGFGGPVEVTVGMDGEGTLSGVRVGGSNFSETAGLGAKSKEPAFYEQFAGKTYPVDLSKNGGEIDAITAATITSSAVIRGVNETAKYIADVAGIKLKEPVVAIEELGDNRYGTTAQGVSGPFPVVVTVDDSGAVTAVEVQDTESANDISFLSKVQGNAEYLNQFVGKTAVEAGALDTVSGATVSSSSVNSAVSKILLFVNDPAAYAAQAAAEADVPDVSIPEGAETFTAQANGLTGTFDVTISVDENATVTGIEVGEASSENDVPFLGQVKDNARFLAQFIGTTGGVSADSIDTVAGATISSNGVIDAVNKAWNASQGIVEEEPAPTEAPAVEEAPAAESTGNTAQASGLTGKFDVTVALNEDGTVQGVTLGDSDSDMDKPFLALANTEEFLNQFIGKSLPVSGIDAASGATVSSQAIIDAVNSFASETEAPAEAPAAEETGKGTSPAGEYTESARSFTDDLIVSVTLDENAAVTAISVQDADDAMNAPYVGKVQDEAFLSQFIGRNAPAAKEDVQVITGATFSSNAVTAAVNSVFAQLGIEAPVQEAAPAAEPAARNDTYQDGVYKTSVKGVNGEIFLTVTIENGAVSAVAVQDSQNEADALYVAMVQDEAFLAQFQGAKAPVEDIDVLAGATFSAQAVLRGVNRVLEAAAE